MSIGAITSVRPGDGHWKEKLPVGRRRGRERGRRQMEGGRAHELETDLLRVDLSLRFPPH